eukprot:g3004.t1
MASKERNENADVSASLSTTGDSGGAATDVVQTDKSPEITEIFDLARVTKEGRITIFRKKEIPPETEPTSLQIKRRGGDKHVLFVWNTDAIDNVKKKNMVDLNLAKCDVALVDRSASVPGGPRIVLTSHDPFRLPGGKKHETSTALSIISKDGSEEKTWETFKERLIDALRRSKTSESTRRQPGGRLASGVVADDVEEEFASSVRYEDLLFMARIGSGTSGQVFRARYVPLTIDVAVKRIPKESADRRELRTLRELKHSNIPRYYGCCEHADERDVAYIYVVMELCDRGNLQALLGSKNIIALCRERTDASRSRAHPVGPWSDRLFRRTLLGIAEGMAQMHLLGFAHRDLKPANVMLTGPDFVAKIADFGTVKHEELGDLDAAHRTATYGKGSPVYMPWMDYRERETGSGVLYVPKRHDVYSFGVMVWEMYTRVKPYSWYANWSTARKDIEQGFVRLETSNAASIRTRSSRGESHPSREWPKKVAIYWVRWPAALRTLVSACTGVDVTTRPSFEDIKTRLVEDITESTLGNGRGWWRRRQDSDKIDAADSNATKEREQDDEVARGGENAERYKAARADLVSAAHAAGIRDRAEAAIRLCAPPGDLIGPSFVDGLRKKDLDAVVRMVATTTIDISSRGALTTRIVGIHGFGGVGKTCFAQQLCGRVNDVRRAFARGGMFWLTLTDTKVLLREMRKLLHDLLAMHVPDVDAEKESNECPDMDTARQMIRSVLSHRWLPCDRAPVLVVLDDVWNGKLVSKTVPLDVLPPGSVVLMTYRDERVGRDANVTEDQMLTMLSEEASFELLKIASGGIDLPKDAALEVAKRVGYHPMALNIVGRDVAGFAIEEGNRTLVASPRLWKETLDGLNEDVGDLCSDEKETIDGLESVRRYESVFASIALSFRRLRGKAKRRGRHRCFDAAFLEQAYLKWVVFGANARVTVKALMRVWGLKTSRETKACAGVFVQAGLMEQRAEEAGDLLTYRLHDLCRDYVRWRVNKNGGVAYETRACECVSGHRLRPLPSPNHHCDVCKTRIFRVRYHCASECDYDVCAQCWEKSPSRVVKISSEEMQRDFVAWLSAENWEETLTADGDDRSRRLRAREWERTFEVAVGMEVVSRPNAKPSVEGAKVVYVFSGLLRHFGRFVEAKRMAETGLEMMYGIYGSEKVNPDIASSLRNLGIALSRLGDLKEAKKKLEACLTMEYAMYGSDKAHPSIATSLNSLGFVLQAVGDLEEAKKTHQACLKMKYAIYGFDKAHPSIAVSLHNLGGVLQALGDLENAKKTYETCLKMEYAIYATDKGHPDIATSLDSLGLVLRALGDLEEARKKFEASLKMRYALYGTEKVHPDIALSLNCLGVVYKDLGDFEEAKKKYEACLKMRCVIYGTDKAHPSIATSLNNLGVVLQAMGDLEGSKRKHEACLKMHCAIYGFGKAHPDIASSLDNLGSVLNDLGNFEDAKKTRETCLKMRYAMYGTNKPHPDIATSLNNLGSLLQRMGDLKGAKKSLEACLKTWYAIYGTDDAHTSIAASLCNLGSVLRDLGNLEDAKKKLEASLKMRYAIHGTGEAHPSIATSLNNLGDVLNALGDLEEAKKMYEACLKMDYAIYGTDKGHPSIAASLCNLGNVLQNLGDLEDAKKKYEACLKMHCAIYGPDKAHPDIAISLNNLGRVLQAMGDLDEAKKMYEACLKMFLAIFGKDSTHRFITMTRKNMEALS